MTVYFTYIHPSDNSFRVVWGAPMEQLQRVPGLSDLTVETYKAFVRERSIPEGAIDVQEMPEGWSPPKDRAFRNAWKRRGVERNFTPEIDIDMPKAREIQLAHVRRQHMRQERELGLDADMRGEDDTSKKAQRQNKLREVVRKIEAARTPDELKGHIL